MLAVLVVVLRFLALVCRGHGAVAVENLALRQQLAVFQRTLKRPPLRPSDREGCKNLRPRVTRDGVAFIESPVDGGCVE